MSWQIRQAINFYGDDFRPPQLPGDVRRILRSLGLAALLALAVIVILLVMHMWSGKQLQQISAQQSALQQRIDDEQSRIPPLTLDPLLQKQQQTAEDNLQNSQRVLTYLSRENIEQRTSFTPLISQLADVEADGVWLSGFSVFDRGAHLQLRGYSRQAQQISLYIAALGLKPAYSHRGFRQVDMAESAGGGMTFVLDTRLPPATSLVRGKQ